MSPKLHQTKLHLQKALAHIQAIETLERLIKPVDSITYKVMVAEEIEQVAVTIHEMLSITFQTLTDEQ